MKNTRNTVIEL